VQEIVPVIVILHKILISGVIIPIVQFVIGQLILVYRIVVGLVLLIIIVCNIVMFVLQLTNVVPFVVQLAWPIPIVSGMHRVVSDVSILPAKNLPAVALLVLPIPIVSTTSKTTVLNVSETNAPKAVVVPSVITPQIVWVRVTVPNVTVGLARIITGSVTPAVIALVVLMINAVEI